ncbi:hypothetical protein GCM10010149_77650 [Nonomuraea roseoviolacea subsp. roseoviolacea]|uniref:STAS domain-containing protein n=1 Tax=Nonomuraea roseoviolacea TaxID=103837 RepID=UPI0031CEA0C0
MNVTDTGDTAEPAAALVLACRGVTMAEQVLRITPLTDPPGLRLEGELDRATLPVLTRALAAMAGRGSFCVDLRGLTFIDVGGLRALVTVAAGLSDGHVVTMRAPSPQVRRLLVLTGWHQLTG